jgi:hypothetical protein
LPARCGWTQDRPAVERDDGDVVVGDRTWRSRAPTPSRLELGALHRARAIDHEDNGDVGLLLDLLGVEPYRHDLLDLGALVAARAERVLAARHDQAAAHLRDVGVERLHLPGAHQVRGDVGHQHEVELLELLGAGRDAVGAAHRDVDVLVLEGALQVAGLPGLAQDAALDVEHVGPALDRRGHHRLVVLALGVVLELGQLQAVRRRAGVLGVRT